MNCPECNQPSKHLARGNYICYNDECKYGSFNLLNKNMTELDARKKIEDLQIMIKYMKKRKF